VRVDTFRNFAAATSVRSGSRPSAVNLASIGRSTSVDVDAMAES
jgi:hypothetical protein